MSETVEMKRCRTCGERKPTTEYYASSTTRGGLFHDCKKCHCLKTRTYRRNNDEVRRRDRERNKKRRAYRQALNKEYLERYPLETQARRKVTRAIARGALVSQPCEVCGAEKTHAHHEDYSKPLDVIWLCPRHHAQVHAGAKLKYTIENDEWVRRPFLLTTQPTLSDKRADERKVK